MKIIAFFILFTIVSCTNIDQEIDRRIKIFEKSKIELFDSIYVQLLREQLNPNSLDYIVTKTQSKFRGYIQTKPDKYWVKYGDTINQQFLQEFSDLECRKLYNFNNFVFFEFNLRKSRVIVFKGKPNFDNYYINTIRPTEYKNGWKYIITDFKSKN